MTDHPRDSHQWYDPGHAQDWTQRARTRDEERLPRLKMLVGFIPFERDEAISVLDIGAGYGLLSQVILEEFPRCQMVWHDFSEVMETYAHQHLERFEGRVHYVRSDLANPDWGRALGGPFHAVVSAIAIHNVRPQQRIPSIYQEVFLMVKEGGCFLNSEIVGPSGPLTQRFYRLHRLLSRQEQLRQRGIEKSLVELEEEQQPRTMTQMQHDHASSLESQLLWLRQAGFHEVDCLWKDMGQAIIGGYRLTKSTITTR